MKDLCLDKLVEKTKDLVTKHMTLVHLKWCILDIIDDLETDLVNRAAIAACSFVDLDKDLIKKVLNGARSLDFELSVEVGKSPWSDNYRVTYGGIIIADDLQSEEEAIKLRDAIHAAILLYKKEHEELESSQRIRALRTALLIVEQYLEEVEDEIFDIVKRELDDREDSKKNCRPSKEQVLIEKNRAQTGMGK